MPRWTHFRQQVWSDGVGLTAPRRPVLGPALRFDPAIVGATRLADSASKRDDEATCRASRRMRARLVQTGSGKHHTFRCCLQVALPTRGHVRRRRTDSPAGRRQRQVEGRIQCWARTESTPCTSAWNGSMSHVSATLIAWVSHSRRLRWACLLRNLGLQQPSVAHRARACIARSRASYLVPQLLIASGARRLGIYLT